LPASKEPKLTLANPFSVRAEHKGTLSPSLMDGIERDWTPKQIIIVEFLSMEKARELYDAPEYAQALRVRQHALRRRLILVEGLSPTAAP